MPVQSWVPRSVNLGIARGFWTRTAGLPALLGNQGREGQDGPVQLMQAGGWTFYANSAELR